jgi:hypothetical protein
MIRRVLLLPLVAAVLLSESVLLPAPAEAGPPRWEYWEGRGEIARERREMRRDLRRARTQGEARRAYREGMREIARERREMRREIRRSMRRWY